MSRLQEEQKIINLNKNTYNKILPYWENSTRENYDFSLHKKCRDIFKSKLSGNRILEVGCGLGYDSIEFRKDGYDIFATDITSKMLLSLKKKCKDLFSTAMDMINPSFKTKYLMEFTPLRASCIFQTLSETVINNFYRLLRRMEYYFYIM